MSGARLQERLTSYAGAFDYGALPDGTVGAAKARIIDTLAAAVGGFSDEPCRIARDAAQDMQTARGATVIGTRARVPPDVAAFVNGTAARSGEMNDVYHRPGSRNGHPSDVIAPLLAVAEYAGASGKDLIAAVVLAYEVYLRFADAAHNKSFDAANFCCFGAALGAGRLLGLNERQLANALSIAAVSSNALNQSRTGHLTMWKSAAAGQAGRAGVSAALLARSGMEGPHLPFEGTHGWCNHVAREPIVLEVMGGGAAPFKIDESFIKPRAACLHTLAPVLAAEKVAAAIKGRIGEVDRVLVEVYRAKERSLGSEDMSASTGEHHWNPQTRETADHSIPYCVAATLIDGTISPRAFEPAKLRDPGVRALLRKVELSENAQFTDDYEHVPVRYRARVTAFTATGQKLAGETGGEHGDVSDPIGQADLAAKFRLFVAPTLNEAATDALLGDLWSLERSPDVSPLPIRFARAEGQP